jgi:hypothetical protein
MLQWASKWKHNYYYLETETVPLCEVLHSQAVPVCATKAYTGSGGIDPLILNLATLCAWVVSLTTWPLCPLGKSPPPSTSIDRTGGWVGLSHLGGFQEEMNLFPLPARIQTPGLSARSWVVILTATS